ncbi:SDR family NAD(P)-dependent oxidoreductase [Azospirillum sp. TSO22-1]|uniref:SDR family NAD(P)-dependent oxidoreductase n=1 Tax=Azospirillum sp. TSO22-1 TaxID=716789 RepID=UPI000D6110B7|nr:SDR family NAD(P)-dependent oxidoreductase [Azospirillum sp. TSO22-1]PWC43863.1 protein CapI [Azospirillum sp. TSO22-1]
MTILVTGAAGFIGSHLSAALMARGETVLGIDDVNAYYSVALKEARLARLTPNPAFRFLKVDIADRAAMEALRPQLADVTGIVHLAAQAGVRYSLENPYAYVEANVMGHLCMLEMVRNLPNVRNFVYASSSSVYGGNKVLPFSVEDRVDSPVSIYAATKKADELMSHAYSHLYGFPATGLRFFTVYGPWGRPDMAAYLFADAILAGRPIRVFNAGEMQRDFTYIDDVVAGILAALDRPVQPDESGVRHRVYNLGNHRSERLLDFIGVIEQALGRAAIKQMEPMQPGDVPATYADIEASRRDLGFEPATPVSVGIPRFIEWYKEYHGVK